MTDLLEQAVAVVRDLPGDIRDEIARVMLALARPAVATHKLTAEETAEQAAADAGESRGDYASEEEVRAIWSKHGLRGCA